MRTHVRRVKRCRSLTTRHGPSFGRTTVTSRVQARTRIGGFLMSRMRFGIFMAPFHPAGVNPTILLESDLELIEHLDRLDYDEAWIG